MTIRREFDDEQQGEVVAMGNNATMRIGTWEFETASFHVMVAEISDGRVSLKLKPKDKDAVFFATGLGDLIQEGNQMFVGDDLTVEWKKDTR